MLLTDYLGSRSTPTPNASANGSGTVVRSSVGSGRSTPVDRRVLSVLERTLAYARERDYTGWDYGDGMSSRLWRTVPIDNKWLNLAFQEVVKRSPVNIRPLLLVEQRRNYKGGALFAVANWNRHELSGVTDGEPTTDYAEETRRLLDWLVDAGSEGHSGFGVGHPHDIQDLQGYAEAGIPDAVVTSYAVRALLCGADLDPNYAEVARNAADFVVEDLRYREFDDGTARITYSENHPGSYYTLNAGALGGRLFVDLHEHFGRDRYRDRARRILDYIVECQKPCGGWLYRDPPSASHLSMDNHHNGFILESLQRYREVTGDRRYDDAIESSLSFHRSTLFDDDGAPNFDESSTYPRDIHACAQGILVFTYAGDLAFARHIIEWTLENLYAGGGRFYFQKCRFHTKRVTLMRWCQAWMAYALSEYATVAADLGTET